MSRKVPSTAQEALLTEILGDLGELHGSVKALPEQIRASAEAASTLAGQVERDLAAMVNDIKDQAAEEFKQTTQKEITSLLRQLSQGAKSPRPRFTIKAAAVWIIGGILCSILAGLTAIFTAQVLYFDQLNDEATLGRRVIAVWPSLPPAVQRSILEGRAPSPEE